MKRFYSQVTVSEAEGGFQVLLDGRAVLTPAKAPLVLSSRPLAEGLAAEWAGQGEKVKPTTMPLMSLVSTTLDLTVKQRAVVIEQLAAYAATDLLCYRVEHPAELAAREALVWQPLLDWAALRYDAALHVVVGVMPREQPEGACRALAAAVAGYDDWRLTALQVATTACGSLVVGLALVEGRIDGAQAFEACQLHETYQIERWGEDYEAADRRSALKFDLADVRRFVELLGN